MDLWRSIRQKLNNSDPHDWPTGTSTIDIVTVIRQEELKGREVIVSYLASLTYFYRNPDLQMGDYCRVFEKWEEATAQSWAASHKGRTVQVHVDPRDPTHSVLLDEDLNA